jgi:nucleotide-binding universal stress UspA family protein
MMKRVVVAIDGSLNAEQALPTAAGIARRAHAQLILVHALDYRYCDYPGETPQTNFVNETTEDCARRYLERLARRTLERWQVAAEIVIAEGEAVPTLLEKSASLDAQLLVMTTHGRGPVRRLWLGSVSDRIVREAGTPVLLIHAQTDTRKVRTDEPFRHVLVPLDGSDTAERVLPRAAELAEQCAARLTLVHFVQPAFVMALPGMLSGFAASSTDPADNGDVVESAHKYLGDVRSVYGHVTREIDEAVLPATFSVSDDILEYADEHSADLIALATHGHGGVRRFVVGSVADKVIRGASVPVLVYKAQQFK